MLSAVKCTNLSSTSLLGLLYLFHNLLIPEYFLQEPYQQIKPVHNLEYVQPYEIIGQDLLTLLLGVMSWLGLHASLSTFPISYAIHKVLSNVQHFGSCIIFFNIFSSFLL